MISPHRALHEELEKLSSVSEQIDFVLSKLRLNEECEQNLQRFIDFLQTFLDSKFDKYKPVVLTLGSFANGLGTYDSDLDIFIKFENLPVDILDYHTALLALEAIENDLFSRFNSKMFKYTIVKSRRCPIIKLNFRLLRKVVSKEIGDGYEFNKCDISVSSIYGVLNSKFIRFLSLYDRRFYQMALILKYWAKENELIDKFALSTYAFTMLIIFFLQSEKPAIFPTVMALQTLACQQKMKPVKVYKWNFEFCDDPSLIVESQNQSTTAELLVRFFK